MARFFIDRPIFAWVIAIIIMMAGLLAINTLPIAQYPSIAPPAVTISASYTGASAQTVQDSVTQIIEQQMKGIDNLQYMSSTSDSFGNVSITLTFTNGTDPDIAQVQVQNKLQQATSLLPQKVQQAGVSVSKSSASFLLVAGFYSEDGSMSQTDIADYVSSSVQDIISRVPGVGDVQLFGAPYAMRIWLDPSKLNNYKLTPADVSSAIEAQNAQVSSGQLGGAPAVAGQQLNATITAQSYLQTPEQFRKIQLKVESDGSIVRLGDVARVELGAQSYDVVARYNGNAAAGLGIKLATNANALDTAAGVKATINELAPYFPQGLKAVFPYDTTPFVKISIEEVVKTLGEAIVLVFLVMYLFMQNFRATLIPTIAVPVVLLGTFGVLSACGFSINTLTMFAMVLAIGLLVDDAIVVVENVERIMSEEGLPPKEATRKSMGQITGALVGIALVLSAVFVPMAFMSGSTGVIYRQFSITIVSAMTLSVLVAMILTPALCATLLKPVEKGHGPGHEYKGLFGLFNRGFDGFNKGTQSLVGGMVKRGFRMLLIYALIVVGVGYIFVRIPTSFLPDEDQGILLVQAILPAGATQERTLEVMKKVEHHFLEDEKRNVNSLFTVTGFSFAGSGQNMGIAFIMLKDWSQRKAEADKVPAVAGRAMGAFSQIKDALVFAFAPPAVIELGNATGFDFYIQDRGNLGHDALMQARNMFLGMASQDPRLMAVRPNGQEDSPQYKVNIDQEKAGALGVSIADINNLLSVAWGGSYINDFIDKGRIKKVYMQGDAPYRMLPNDINQWYVRNGDGDMVPFSAFATADWNYGSPQLQRYNGLSAYEIMGQPAPGVSSGDAMKAVEEIMRKLPAGIGYEWTGLSLQEQISGNQAPMLYAISVLVVFLCLAALYESWSIPFSVILVVPLGVLGALLFTDLRGLSNDVYFQVGLLTTVGLAAKNAILIVEFAKELHEHGMSLIDASIEAIRMRLRPIIMTSLAFGLGVVPLVIANGAGSGSQNAIGTGVLGGMVSSTLLGVIFVPVFFVVISKVFGRKKAKEQAPTPRIEESH
ncbi:hydrophobe/amphiphile efflux-1 family RND transporter [Pokkaliibacter plantistimulans]|uniref:Efflux pump membrane transporter n=1 Tax=Proteobacteria bacterium 228 TaxID=2083153 RepID=A0A2S5KRJ2_9PROT|nr:efflux RND transporter permease subunit [Pokkaliibacter plantistimulans]PPC77471.1 hydrophobe/amphiphile efflux-1 family RND transporter [Pokkaliibacter plantistimulans]